MAINWRDRAPIGGRPTRRMACSCAGDESGMSEKSIFGLDVRGAFLPTRAARTDETDRFAIACSPLRIDHHQDASFGRPPQAPKARFASRVLQIGTVQ